MADHVITFPKVNLGVNNSGLQLIITFTVTGSAVSWDADDKGIFVMQYGETSWRYDLDNPLLTPGTQDIVIHDRDDHLSHLFFSEDSTEDDTEKRGKVELYLNDVLEFSGTILEDSIYYDVAEKLLKFSAANDLDIINKTALYYEDEDGSGGLETKNYNPFGYTESSIYLVQYLIEDIYKLVDPSLVIYNDKIKLYSEDQFAASELGWVNITDITVNASSVTITVSTTGSMVDGDKVIIMEVEGITDLNNYDWTVSNVTGTTFDVPCDTSQTYTSGGKSKRVYIYSDTDLSHLYIPVKNLYFNPDYGLSSCGDVLRKLATDFRCFAGLKNGQEAFFYQLFSFDSSDLQTLGTVLKWEKTYTKRVLDYVEARTEVTSGEVRIYSAGTRTGIDDDQLIISKTVFTFFDDTSGDDSISDASEFAYSNFVYYVDSSENSIYFGKNEFIADTWHDSGWLQAQSWYKFRGSMPNSRIDVFEVVGVDYDFLKNFVYDGKRYQIVSLKKHWEQGKSEIEAIYLGLDV